MKKITIIAVFLAILFSAFTTADKAFAPPYTYWDGNNLENVPNTVDLEEECPEGNLIPCFVEIGGVSEQVFHSDGETPLLRDDED